MEKSKPVPIVFVPDEAVKSFTVTLKQFNKAAKLTSPLKAKFETPKKERKTKETDSKILRTPRESAVKARRRLAAQSGKNEEISPSSTDEESEEECLTRRKEYGGGEGDDNEAATVLFGFQTPKRKSKMTLNTPQCVRQQENSEKISQIPHKTTKIGSKNYSVNEASDSSESDSNYSDENSDDSSSTSNEDEEENQNQIEAAKNQPETKNKSRKKLQINVDEPANRAATEEYFLAQTSSALTSDRTLNRLKNPRLAPEEVNTLLANTPGSHQQEKQILMDEHRSLFPYWNFILRESFNVLLYGLGSKRLLLDEFRSRVLKDETVLVVNGFFPGLTLKEILNSITEDILEHRGNFSSPMDQLEFIESEMRKNYSQPVYIIIHNIDGPCLQYQREQDFLCRLAALKNVRILASMDHINGALIWDQQKFTKFQWVCFDCTTFASYFEEISYENSLLVQQSANLAASSLARVFASLTTNAKTIFLLIAKNQLEHKDSSSHQGLPFHELYQNCRDNFLVNSDLTLRAQLTEFRDHKLLRMKRSPDGTEVLVIPLERTALEEFVTKYEEEN